MPETDEEQPILPDEEDQPLTLGQRLSAKATPAPVMPAEPPPDVKPTFDPKLMPDGILSGITTPQPPTPPTGSQNPNLANLAKQQAQVSTPINPMDPATGKTKPQYKMGLGQRILGTLANAASGFARDGSAPAYVGPGATNWRFGREEAARQGKLEGINTQIKTQEQLDSENEKLYRDATRQAYETQVGEARKETAGAQAENSATKASLADSQRQLNEARANKLDNATPPEPKTTDEIALALSMAKMKGDKAAIAKYSGALEEIRKLKAAERTPKDTTAADVAKAIQVAEFRSREHDKVNREQDSEREKRYAELDKNPALKYTPDKLAAAKAGIDKELETKYAPRHQKADADADKMLDLTKSGGPLKSNATPAPKTPPKVGTTIQVDGKPYKVTGFNPKTNKPIVAPAGN
jgi:hypothetical protein